MVLLDAHLHLNEADVIPSDTDVIFFLNSTSPGDWNRVSVLAGRHPAIVPFFGVHPWFTADVPGGWEHELKQVAGKQSGGIGEIGLDPLKGAPLEVQKDIFSRQVHLACETGRPFVLHCVRAWGDTLKILHDAYRRELPPFMAHSFGGSREIQDELVKIGGYISFSLKDMERREEKIRPLITAVPEGRLLLETDFPQCGKEPYRVCIGQVYERASLLLDIDIETLKRKVADNGAVLTYPASAGR